MTKLPPGYTLRSYDMPKDVHSRRKHPLVYRRCLGPCERMLWLPREQHICERCHATGDSMRLPTARTAKGER
jgi:hypothetical protein